VNGEPLVRPAWYFDTTVQGEGITDVTTHLVDLAQWLVGGDSGPGDKADVVLTGARQWPTSIPLETFSRITGMTEFPAEVEQHVSDGALQYHCNANIRYTLRGVPVEIESIWDLAIPEGGGDTHHCVLRGAHADLVVDQGPASGFETRLRVVPTKPGDAYADALARALSGLQTMCSGVSHVADGEGFRVEIPAVMHHGHEARFAEVLNQFLGYVDCGKWPQRIGRELVTKYSLLAKAWELSHR
jgi:predicted dehydrogenase